MTDISKRQIVVIGGGPAGLMAAGQAAELGAEVILLEKMRRPARKLRITGKGRCNLTNNASVEDFTAHFGQKGRFLRSPFSRFFSSELREFFDALGVETTIERGGRIFPASNQAHDVVDALQTWVQEKGVRIQTDADVRSILLTDGQCRGVSYADNSSAGHRKTLAADAVILATGGSSYPGTGSTGDGYRMAEKIGHNLVPVRPALVPLRTADDTAKRLQGLSLRNIEATFLVDGQPANQAFGEMLFTHFGISGPIILTESGWIVDALLAKHRVEISIDLKPALDQKKLDARLQRDFDQHGRRSFKRILEGLLPRKLIPVCIDLVGIHSDKPAHQITSAERERLCTWLKGFKLVITEPMPISQALVTAGGVHLKEINPKTMESRLINGLYFAGEVIDLDGDTGGYNLQASFSTGWVAGRAAAASILDLPSS